jgi:hypothetical protein
MMTMLSSAPSRTWATDFSFRKRPDRHIRFTDDSGLLFRVTVRAEQFDQDSRLCFGRNSKISFFRALPASAGEAAPGRVTALTENAGHDFLSEILQEASAHLALYGASPSAFEPFDQNRTPSDRSFDEFTEALQDADLNQRIDELALVLPSIDLEMGVQNGAVGFRSPEGGVERLQ